MKTKLLKIDKTQKEFRKKARARIAAKRIADGKPPPASRPVPGGLERSIDFDVQPGRAIIFVSGFSEAKDYAVWIHDGEYNLGIGSLAKAAQGGNAVGNKYLQRAFDELQVQIKTTIDEAIRKATGAK
jgi:hypothetical protein